MSAHFFPAVLTALLSASVLYAAEPSASIRPVSSGADGVTLEVTTGDLRLVPAPEPNAGFERIILDGAGASRAVGAPRLPVIGTLVGVPPGAHVEVEVLETDLAAAYENVRLEPVARPVTAEVGDRVQPMLRFQIDQALYGRDANYPAALVALGEPARIREQDVVRVEVYPVQYNPRDGSVRHYSRVLFRLRFVGARAAVAAVASDRPPSPVFDDLLQRVLVNSASLKRPESRNAAAPSTSHVGVEASAGSPPQLKIAVEADGLYRVTGSDLQAAGLSLADIDPRTIRVLNHGIEAAIRVSGEGNPSLGLDDTIELYGQAMTGEFTRRNIYWLEYGGAPGARMSLRDVAPTGTAPLQSTFVATVHAEDGNGLYWQAMPNGEGLDHYFWQEFVSPSSNSVTVMLPQVAAQPATASIRVALFGRTDAPPNPDHHTRILVNGSVVDDQYWNGQIPFEHSATFPQALLVNGANTIGINLLNDTGATVDSIYLNFIEIDYLAGLGAQANALRFGGTGAGRVEYRVDGFTQNAVDVYDVTDPNNVVYGSGGAVTGTPSPYSLSFEDDAVGTRTYLAVADAAKRSPAAIVLDVPSNLHAAGNGADYLIISHADFLNSITPLLDLRARQGLRTMAVDVANVYDEFSFGVFDPTAIRDFIRYAYESWQPPAPTFVLLVGDANQDYLDFLGTGTPNWVPTHLFESAFGQFPEDNFYAAVSGDDILPNVFLGRISVRTAAQADGVVAKIVEYESQPPGAPWSHTALFVADSGAEGFSGILDDLAAQFLPASYAAHRVYLGDFASVDAARTALLNELNQGALIASYLGHGAVSNWSGQNLLTSSDVSSLTNHGAYPLVTTLDCINGYYPHPNIPFSLAETLLNQPNAGAVAVWSPTGLGFLSEYESIGDQLFANLFGAGESVVGMATTHAAVTSFVTFGASADNLHELVLFGDPALNLALNPNVATQTPAGTPAATFTPTALPAVTPTPTPTPPPILTPTATPTPPEALTATPTTPALPTGTPTTTPPSGVQCGDSLDAIITAVVAELFGNVADPNHACDLNADERLTAADLIAAIRLRNGS